MIYQIFAFRHFLRLVAVFLLILPASAVALTLKSGQVIGADGDVYDGASPEQATNIAKNADSEDWFGNKKSSGVIGKNLFIVVDDKTVFIPIAEVSGKSQEELESIITEFVIDALSADIEAFHTSVEDGVDLEGIARDTAGLANDPVVRDLAREAAEVAVKDPEAAKALVEATINLAKQTASDPAVEQAYEQAVEAAHAAKCAGKEGTGNGC